MGPRRTQTATSSRSHRARTVAPAPRGRIGSLDEVEQHARRTALNLHDGPTQSVSAAALVLDAARAADDLTTARELVKQARGHLDTALHDLRQIMRELRPSALDAEGLAKKIEEYVADFDDTLGPGITLRVRGRSPSMPGVSQVAIFRIVQEALNNVRKHARARAARVDIRFSADSIECVVSDDGVGFEPSNPAEPNESGGLGILGMYERAALAGGTLGIESAPGKGTRITAHIPLEADWQ